MAFKLSTDEDSVRTVPQIDCLDNIQLAEALYDSMEALYGVSDELIQCEKALENIETAINLINEQCPNGEISEEVFKLLNDDGGLSDAMEAFQTKDPRVALEGAKEGVWEKIKTIFLNMIERIKIALKKLSLYMAEKILNDGPTDRLRKMSDDTFKKGCAWLKKDNPDSLVLDSYKVADYDYIKKILDAVSKVADKSDDLFKAARTQDKNVLEECKSAIGDLKKLLSDVAKLDTTKIELPTSSKTEYLNLLQQFMRMVKQYDTDIDRVNGKLSIKKQNFEFLSGEGITGSVKESGMQMMTLCSDAMAKALRLFTKANHCVAVMGLRVKAIERGALEKTEG